MKPCKTIIIEEEPPPAPPASGKHLAEVIARLSPFEIGVVLSHLPSSTVQKLGANYWFAAFLPGNFHNFEKQSCPQFCL